MSETCPFPYLFELKRFKHTQALPAVLGAIQRANLARLQSCNFRIPTRLIEPDELIPLLEDLHYKCSPPTGLLSLKHLTYTLVEGPCLDSQYSATVKRSDGVSGTSQMRDTPDEAAREAWETVRAVEGQVDYWSFTVSWPAPIDFSSYEER